MEKAFLAFQDAFGRNEINPKNKNLKKMLYKMKFLFTEEDYFSNQISQYLNESQIIILDEYQEKNGDKYFFICFDYNFIIIHRNLKSNKPFLNTFVSRQKGCKIYSLKSISIPEINIKLADEIFIIEINSFSYEFTIKEIKFQAFWNIIVGCISGFFIKQSYKKLREKNDEKIIKNFLENQEKIDSATSFIKLRNINHGGCSIIDLIYYIKTEDLFALKTPYNNSIIQIEKERNNYLNIQYSFIPKYYGYIENNKIKCLILEYIEGETLDKYDLSKLNIKEKYNIIFELMLTIQYIHSYEYIYRDLHFSNIMINENKDAILIDFDRLSKIEDQKTLDFMAIELPELYQRTELSKKSDIFLLGYIIYYMLFGKRPRKNEQQNNEVFFYDLSDMIQGSREKSLFKLCFNVNPDKRASIVKLIDTFYYHFLYDFDASGNKEKRLIELFESNSLITMDDYSLYIIGIVYLKDRYITCDINKAIRYLSLAADKNNQYAQYALGQIYYDNEYVKCDINKAIHYLTLAANQNNSDAQNKLGVIYESQKDINKALYYYFQAANNNNSNAQNNIGFILCEGVHIKRDVKKGIYYLTLSANHNNCFAQHYLGKLYHEAKYVKRDIDKAIHYLSLAANNNFPLAQDLLGYIYYEGRYVTRDINKAIHYLLLAANQNNSSAQNNLGMIYSLGKYIQRDINKGIHYLSLAAEQNELNAQFNLGYIYYTKEYNQHDIKKAIYYLSLAANRNHQKAQYILGLIYYKDKSIECDINKAIFYFSLSANQNDSKAQLNLGLIYYEGKYIMRDINKAIHYFKLAADQNDLEAQYNLGLIYSEGVYIMRDTYKAIYYFTLAAKQNDFKAQYNLGIFYYNGTLTTRDIKKAIHYLTLSADQNNSDAQYSLGLIYLIGEHVDADINKAIYYLSNAANNNCYGAQNTLGVIYLKGQCVNRDIKKALYYLTLAANANYLKAQFNLGIAYYDCMYIAHDTDKAIYYLTLASNQNFVYAQYILGYVYYLEKNIKKSIYYLSLASDQNFTKAQHLLGYIYYEGKYVTRDINKASHYLLSAANANYPDSLFYLAFISLEKHDINKTFNYLRLAANQNHAGAQCNLGFMYLEGFFGMPDIDKAINYLTMSANQNCPDAQFILGSIYFKGHHVKYDIQKAIHLFKEASCVKNQYAKNNLGIIYKTGEGVKANPNGCIVYFEEAIHQKGDKFAMFNLAHIYFYEEAGILNIDEAFKLLVKSFPINNQYFTNLLCLVVINKYKSIDLSELEKEFKDINEDFGEKLAVMIHTTIKTNRLEEENHYQKLYFDMKDINLLYYGFRIENLKEIKLNDTRVTINSLFYDGFGNIY